MSPLRFLPWARPALMRARVPQPANQPRPIPTNILRFLSVGVLLVSPAAAQAQPADSTRVVVLGTGTPNPDPDRSGPSLAIVANGTAYLVDAGAGVGRRAASAAAEGFPALRPQRLDIVFLTHLHSDHTIGLPDLIHTGWVMGRAVPLRIFGPPGTRAMAEHLTAAYQADITNRTTGLQPHTENGWKLEVQEVKAGVVYKDSAVTVTALPVHHDGWPAGTSFGYRFETRDRVIVISGDGTPSESIVTACNGCDVLFHEVYSQKGFDARTPDWQRYHADAHTSPSGLAALARRAKPKLLVLYHQLFMGASDDDLIAEIRAAGYAGPVVSARDLGIY